MQELVKFVKVHYLRDKIALLQQKIVTYPLDLSTLYVLALNTVQCVDFGMFSDLTPFEKL